MAGPLAPLTAALQPILAPVGRRSAFGAGFRHGLFKGRGGEVALQTAGTVSPEFAKAAAPAAAIGYGAGGLIGYGNDPLTSASRGMSVSGLAAVPFAGSAGVVGPQAREQLERGSDEVLGPYGPPIRRFAEPFVKPAIGAAAKSPRSAVVPLDDWRPQGPPGQGMLTGQPYDAGMLLEGGAFDARPELVPASVQPTPVFGLSHNPPDISFDYSHLEPPAPIPADPNAIRR